MFSLCLCLTGQRAEISINNPSFEDIPHKGNSNTYIRGWYDCGLMLFPGETPPDIHPLEEIDIERSIGADRRIRLDTVRNGIWKVSSLPSDGRTFLGMVVRDNDTWESVSQRMRVSLEEGKCYSFSIDLARSNLYVSGSKVTMKEENYVNPAILRIWGGTSICGKQEELGQSITVENRDWRTYEFEFRPERSVNYFTLEAFYKYPSLFAYNGHILIDNASTIKEIPCDESEELDNEQDQVIAQATSTKPRTPVRTSPAPVTEALVDEIVEAPVETEEAPSSTTKNLIEGLQGSNFKKGQIIRISSIYFDADSTNLNDNSLDAIDQVYDFMRRNENIVIEVGGHTATVPKSNYCDWLSAKRAKAVATRLARKGISTKRLYYKGYGKRKPIIPNEGNNMAARRKNQRVEIKILQTDYRSAG